MAKGYLTPEELAQGNLWLKTIFFPAIKTDFIDKDKYVNYCRGYKTDYIIAACKKIYDGILNLKFDVDGSVFDSALYDIAVDSTSYKDESGNKYYFKQKILANILANMCAKAKIYWDAASHTDQELEFFKKTIFGAALWDFYCFTNQTNPADKAVKVSSPKTSGAASTGSTSSGGGAGAGHTLYRHNCGGLVGTAKETNISQENGRMFWIGGEFVKAGRTQPRIHVSPQDSSSPLTVKFNSGQGYNDCVLYFKSRAQCQAFLDICNQNKPATVQSLQMKQCWEDNNGYCEVHTQWGNAYILAKKLHEDLEEDIEKPEKTEEEYLKDIQEAWDALEEFMR